MAKNAKTILPKRPSLTPQPRKAVFTVEDRLNAVLIQLLGGPDQPDRNHMIGAAHAFLLLHEMGLKCISTTAETLLSGGNIYKIDFIERARRLP